MKIFNWMHHKFRQNVDYGWVAQKKGMFADESKKVEHVSVTCERDTNALLLEHENLVDVFNGWENGILTIGTFGFHQLEGFHEEEKEITKEQEEITEVQEEDPSPLVVQEIQEEPEIVYALNTTNIVEMHRQELPAVASHRLQQFLDSPVFHAREKRDEEERKKGERTTLADLFSAEAAGKNDSGGFPQDKSKKPTWRSKHGVPFAKKLMGRKGEESSPSTKLHKMVKKMLKKKIHPAEIELENHVGVDGTKTKNRLGDCVDHGPRLGEEGLAYDSDDNGNESISLLRGSSQRTEA